MLKQYGITHPLLEKYEHAALACYREDWASAEKVLSIAHRAQLSEENIRLLSDFLSWADSDVKRFMWLFYYIQFESGEVFTYDIWSLDHIPMPAEVESTFPGCIKSVVYLLSWENLDRWVKERDLPEAVSEAYFERYRYLVSLNLVTHNTCGLCRLSPFLYGYSKPFFLCLGRLSFQLLHFKDYCELYEDADGNRLFAALPNYRYDESGLQAEEGWIPVHKKTGDVLTAHVFGDLGHLALQPTQIDLKRWRRVLCPADDVITIHIPEGGRLDTEQVLASIEVAGKVFGKYFPQAKAIVCQTWFIDPHLRGAVIRDGSNMAAFADLFNVICGPDNQNHSIFEHVFKAKRQPLEDLVPTTGLQERILRRALSGQKLYWGFGVLKREVFSWETKENAL